jgi:hypothetical protein
MRAGWALNCEDGVVFADAALRTELKAHHPAVVERIEARRRFVREAVGIPIEDSIRRHRPPYAFRFSGPPDDC